MKRKVDWNEEEESDYEHTKASEDEPRIKYILKGLSQPVSRKRPPIYYTKRRLPKIWTLRGHLDRNHLRAGRIFVTPP